MRNVILFVLIALAVILVLGQPDRSAAVERTIYMAAIEPKGGANVGQEPFPTMALPPGKGYNLKPPDATGRWEVSSYRWDPAFVIVQEGDEVTLEMVGINGDFHDVQIPIFVPGEFKLKRGEVKKVSFTANRAGIFPIICTNHQPTMMGYIVILSRR